MAFYFSKKSKVVKIKLDLKDIILITFFAVLLFIGPATVFDYRVSHEFPYGYFASDAFQHQIRAESIKDAGNFRYEASYISQGFKGTIGRYPPVLYHIAVIFSYTSRLEVYDAIYFIVLFFSLLSVISIYILVGDFNKNVAIISLPISIIAFTMPASIGFSWGHWPSLLAQSFLILLAWTVSKIDLKKSYLLIGIALTSIILTHTSEAVFGLIFIFLFFFAKMSKDFGKKQFITIMISAVIAFVACIYYLIIFQNTWAKPQPYSFVVEPIWTGNPGFYIIGFGALLIFMAAGILFSLLKIKDMHASLVFAFSMLLCGFLNYIGFGLRSFQIRFFWPIYLSVFFGFGVYMLLKLLIKSLNVWHSATIFAIFSILLLGPFKLPILPHYEPSNSAGIMNPYHWKVLQWISKNTQENAKIYFFYGDIYSQDALLRNSKRVSYQVDPDDFIKALQERKIKREYITELPGDGGGGITKRLGLFTFDYMPDNVAADYSYGPMDICNFDYYVFDKASKQEVLAKYNMLLASELAKNGNFTKAFENEIAIILKNEKPGGNCIEERNF